jgi:hypothetical protein
MRRLVDVIYDTSSRSTSISYRSSAIHCAVISCALSDFTYRIVKEGKEGKIRTHFGRETFIMQNGVLITSVADMTLDYDYGGPGRQDSQAVLILQAGFPESYSVLLQSIFEWFKRVPGLKAALFIKIEETPSYKIPLLEKTAFNDPNLAIPSSMDPLTHSDVHLQDPANPNSPLGILGFRWVGEITASIETWVRDQRTGEPVMRKKA